MLKDRALQTYYEEVLATLKSPGWKYLVEDIQKMIDTYDRLSSVHEAASLDFRRGQLDILYWMVNRRETMEYAYNSLLEDDRVADV